MAGGVLPALPTDLFACFQGAQRASGYALRTLNPHQNDTVVAMIDQIFPVTDTPGARAARVNEFIDVILTEWASDEERLNFLSGLADVDRQSNTLFGKNFTDSSPDQQLTLLRSLDESAAVIRSARKPRPPFWEPEGRDTQLQEDFFTVFKQITLHVYYPSEIYCSQELTLQISPRQQHA